MKCDNREQANAPGSRSKWGGPDHRNRLITRIQKRNMNSRHIYRNNGLDQLLICCPILIPIVYSMLLGQFPTYEALIFLAFVVLLGETHFGLTWLFFLDRRNWQWALRKPFYSLVIPAAMTTGFLAVYFWVDPALAILLSSVFSAYHVTMQSAGITRLYGGRTAASNAAVKIILGSSALFLLVGFLRFYNPLFVTGAVLRSTLSGLDPNFLAAALIVAIAGTLYLIGRIHREQCSNNFLFAALTGSLLYSPYLFASRPEHAIAMGVGMHWCQYVAITLPLYHRKTRNPDYGRTSIVNWNIAQMAAAVLAYALLMGYFRVDQGLASVAGYAFTNSYLIVIPIVFQNLHYYSEMFTWKFSDPHIRENVGKYVFAPEAQSAAQPVRA